MAAALKPMILVPPDCGALITCFRREGSFHVRRMNMSKPKPDAPKPEPDPKGPPIETEDGGHGGPPGGGGGKP